MDAKLILFKPNGKRKEFPLQKATVTLGRAKSCDLSIPIPSVSRSHCKLSIGQDEVTVHDTGSTNGTFVNNRRVEEELLEAGDRLIIGPVVFTVQIDGKPEEIKSVSSPVVAASKSRVAEEINFADEVTGPNSSPLDTVIEEAEEGDEAEQIDDSDPLSALEDLIDDETFDIDDEAK